MAIRFAICCILLVLAVSGSASAATIKVYSAETGGFVMIDTVEKSPDDWRKQLSPEQYYVLREQGTERAFANKYHDHRAPGLYRCAGCGLDLFRSQDKYDSGTGWPSFTAPIAKENVRLKEDRSFFSLRIEVLCVRCSGHLGHVFDDGPPPTGKRYCMNSAALDFVPSKGRQ